MIASLSRAAAALVLSAAVLGACQSSGPSSAPVESSDALADRVTERFDASMAQLDGFRVAALGTALFYVGTGDSTQAFGVIPDPSEPPPADMLTASMFSYYPPNGRYVAEGIRGAEFKGVVERDGVQAYVVETTDPTAIGMSSDSSKTDNLARVYVDAETFDVRELYHRFRLDTLAQPLAQRILYEEWRDVDGSRFPFRVRRIQEGMLQLITQEQKMIAGGSLAIREQSANSMPPGPERDAAVAAVAREKRIYERGIAEDILSIADVTLNPAVPDSLLRERAFYPFPAEGRPNPGYQSRPLQDGAGTPGGPIQ